jgi:methyl-accepting chemotaxis protein
MHFIQAGTFFVTVRKKRSDQVTIVLRRMRLYTSLSKIKYLDKSYSLKYLFISFLGVHIPLIGIIIFVLVSGIKSMSPAQVIECVLIFTLLACAATLWVQNALAKPIIVTKNALVDYLSTKTLPKLPGTFKDEAGLLMANTNTALYELDNLIKEKRDFIYLLSHDLKTPYIMYLPCCSSCRKIIITHQKMSTCTSSNSLPGIRYK